MGWLIMKVFLKLLKLMTEVQQPFVKHFREKLFIGIFNCAVYRCVSAGDDVSDFSTNLWG